MHDPEFLFAFSSLHAAEQATLRYRPEWTDARPRLFPASDSRLAFGDCERILPRGYSPRARSGGCSRGCGLVFKRLSLNVTVTGVAGCGRI